ncbi:asparagine-tRNA ligase [Polytolypa hystricis UAMH7299]|uniref:asparagine--tRNA ligase n=1 Tax=Polytolypa hystricis (strain UAMH7299) TaxID=1447883 RepID=A0A2B7YBJ9_POLH7|nr:asparagine-tRNA ligase [Polytolypa hystricis UAMH7299]
MNAKNFYPELKLQNFYAAETVTPQTPPHSSPLYNAGRAEPETKTMRAWRRCFTTSAAGLSRQTPPLQPALTQRCAQLLNAPKQANGDAAVLDSREVRVKGTIRSVRKQKRFAFAEISDGSTVVPLQAILTPADASPLTTGSTVEVSGSWQPCPPGKEQTHELHVKDVKVIGTADSESYPIQKKYHSPDFLRQIPHLRLRTPFNSLLSRFRSECIFQVANVLRAQSNYNFVQVQPPLITSADCEGAGEVFTLTTREQLENPKTVDFFRTPKYLTVSSQLHLEAYAAELGNVWTLSPTFRAEKSDTPRHLSEFYMLEAEMNFVESLDPLLDITESLIRGLTRNLYDSPVGKEMLLAKRTGETGQSSVNDALQTRWTTLFQGPKWLRITYTEAMELLQKAAESNAASFAEPPSWEDGIGLEHEKYIVDHIANGAPVFVTDYAKAVKPFYMAPSTKQNGHAGQDETQLTNRETVGCFDLLFPEVYEIVGGSLREHRLETLIQNMRSHGMIKKTLPADAGEDTYPYLEPGEQLGPLRWYADLRRWGSAPHGGFGIGFDRLVSYLADVSSLRDTVPFPRYYGRADC